VTEPHSAVGSTEGVSILIVDDRRENLVALEAALGDLGYALVTATSGYEALKHCLEREFAAILLDVQMPGLDGFETAKLIRAREKTRDTPIIIITAITEDERFALRGYEAGALDFIFKPVNTDVLRAKLSVFAQLWRRKQLERHEAELAQARLELEKDRRFAVIRSGIERQYKDLVEGIEHGLVWIADPVTWACTFMSPRAEVLLGHPHARLGEAGFWERHLHPDDRASTLEAFGRVARSGSPERLEHRLLRPDGSVIWLNTSVRLALRHDDTPVEELRGLSIDVTHMKQTEAALREAVRTRDEFLSVASHELRTPLTPLALQMQGFLRLADRGALAEIAPEKLRRMLVVSNAQVDRLSRLVDDLLDVGRLAEGMLDLRLSEFDLVEAAAGVIEQFRHQLLEAGLTVQLVAGAPVAGRWDRVRIERVLVNLLTNVAKYAAGKPCDVEVTCDRERARLAVTDRGPGVPAADADRIFGRFERAVSGRHYGGLGLGLFISRQIVEMHAGTLACESGPDGHGARFVMDVPLWCGSDA
jgi:PAS domain S-box-containing protein